MTKPERNPKPEARRPLADVIAVRALLSAAPRAGRKVAGGNTPGGRQKTNMHPGRGAGKGRRVIHSGTPAGVQRTFCFEFRGCYPRLLSSIPPGWLRSRAGKFMKSAGRISLFLIRNGFVSPKIPQCHVERSEAFPAVPWREVLRLRCALLRMTRVVSAGIFDTAPSHSSLFRASSFGIRHFHL